MFSLTGDVAAQDAGTLSGGEKTKLALAQLVNGQHNTLLLDEPTNNLDPPSGTAISTALKAWPGSMILVSHDVEFVRQLEPDRVLLLPKATSTTGKKTCSSWSRSRTRQPSSRPGYPDQRDDTTGSRPSLAIGRVGRHNELHPREVTGDRLDVRSPRIGEH